MNQQKNGQSLNGHEKANHITGPVFGRRQTDNIQALDWVAPEAVVRPQYVILGADLMRRHPVTKAETLHDVVVLKRRREGEETLPDDVQMFSAEISKTTAERFKSWCKAQNYTIKSGAEQALLEFVLTRGG